MKTTVERLNAKIKAMDRFELELMASNVVQSLYLSHFTREDLTDDEQDLIPDDFDGSELLDSEREWDGDTLKNVAGDIENAGLNVGKLAEVSA